MKVLVTGATGQLGQRVVESLLKLLPAGQIAVSVRDPQKAAHLVALGVDVRQGDFNHPETLHEAFAGIDRLLMISTNDLQNRIQQQKAAIQAAKEAGVKLIAYTSVVNATNSPLSLAVDHRATEAALLESGVPYSFLRNNWYLENELPSVHASLQGAPWITSAGKGKVGWATRQDYAEAAAKVLAGEGHDNTIYELSGKPLTQEEFVALVEEVSGKSIPVQQVDDETYGKVMTGAGIPEAMLPFLTGVQQGIRAGALDSESDDLAKLLERPLTPLKDALRELLAAK
ncbi:SDR family oxidoreductase [Paenibacillus sp. NFR01]|uniref:SDR family oxidoreductase n=1 Tax=Paenibacillus sp. NFR01 TaxID=1566279 RepID=UPI0008C31A2C|nr:SDR family oxidoreductase [Paenibacillus sp. NFR01]SEU10934.1 NAD(P)H dehydrogenase (quinone) [Paenibacillus sp. NFR01]